MIEEIVVVWFCTTVTFLLGWSAGRNSGGGPPKP